MNQAEYLKRIDYYGSLEPSLRVLKKLQKQHLLTVPFENLDIHFGRSIELNLAGIFDKVVRQRRGGFCYELNGLFSELLLSIGFEVRRVSARVYRGNNRYGQEFDHLASVIKIDGHEYLSDVGFGEFTFEPLQLALDTIQTDQRGQYFIDRYKQDYLRVNKLDEGRSIPQYIFSTCERKLIEFQDMCHYHQVSPDSHFTQKKMISLPTENGRITVAGDILKVTEGDSVTEIVLENEKTFLVSLQRYFGVEIDKEA